MASAKEIRGQIKATQNTSKITKAMEMVAASKMRKAQEAVTESRAYADGIHTIIANLMQSHPEYKHAFLVPREEVKRVAYIVISSDKGLCGGLNTNVFKHALSSLKKAQETADVEALSIGRRAGLFMKRIVTLAASAEDINDKPEFSEILGVVSMAVEKFIAGDYDEVRLVFNTFVNTMTQQPTELCLLPCPEPASTDEERAGYWDYLYEPDSKEVLDGLLRRYVETIVYQAVLENKACEQSARMVAMKSATDNAKDIISDLQITYNKARQAAITQELAEICAGAAAA
ncbi:MAG: F0F1 ATP synthase subunit gamma [Mariprofundaceae bacterium]|nr:F0F1 ATP synthase subunit gamma [Mariprofundaceae bacterium]